MGIIFLFFVSFAFSFSFVFLFYFGVVLFLCFCLYCEKLLLVCGLLVCLRFAGWRTELCEPGGRVDQGTKLCKPGGRVDPRCRSGRAQRASGSDGPKRTALVSYKDRVKNEEVKRRIRMAIGNYEELLPLVIRRKLRWFGHVTRSSGLSKVCLQGTVEGQRKRGRQKTRWEDNIKEWTGMSWNVIIKSGADRERCRRTVRSSPVAPQRSPGLWDR